MLALQYVSALPGPLDFNQDKELSDDEMATYFKENGYTVEETLETIVQMKNNKTWPSSTKYDIFTPEGISSSNVYIFIFTRPKRSVSCHQQGTFCGTGGGWFNDGCSTSTTITKFELWYSGSTVRAIKATFSHGSGSIHGVAENNHAVKTFANGEKIIAAVVLCGTLGNLGGRVKQIGFVTQNSNGVVSSFGPYGASGGNNMYIVSKNVVSFFGRAGADVDAIGFNYLQ